MTMRTDGWARRVSTWATVPLVAAAVSLLPGYAVGERSITSPTIADVARRSAVVPLAPAVEMVTPARLADTRIGGTTVDGSFEGEGPLLAGSRYRVQVTGRAGVPLDAAGAVVNVTAVDPHATGFLTVHPCANTLPVASSVNYVAGTNAGNEVITGLGPKGGVCVYTFAGTDLTVDVAALVPQGTAVTPVGPARIHESREGATTVDGLSQGTGRTTAGSTTRVPVTGRAGVPSVVDAVVVNVTAVDPTADGFIEVHACLSPMPNASSLNHVAGVNRANELISPVDDGGEICIYTQHDLDLVVDVVGYVPLGTTYAGDDPARLLETRPGAPTIDGLHQGEGALAAGSQYRLQVAGRGDVPADAVAAILNVAAIDHDDAGFLTVHPCEASVPNTSSLNHAAGANTANEIIATLDAEGAVCVYTNVATHAIVDAVGHVDAATGTIVVTKSVFCPPPWGCSPDMYTFQFTGVVSGTIGDGGRLVATGLAPGTYTVREMAGGGGPWPWPWHTGISCNDDNSTVDPAGLTATIRLESGETVTCGFSNVRWEGW